MGTAHASLPTIGFVTTLVDATQFRVSDTFMAGGNGSVSGAITRAGLIHATSAGPLTISVNYGVAHSAIPAS